MLYIYIYIYIYIYFVYVYTREKKALKITKQHKFFGIDEKQFHTISRMNLRGKEPYINLYLYLLVK